MSCNPMSKFLVLLLGASAFLIGAAISSWADAVAAAPAPTPDGDFLMLLLTSLGQLKGLSALGVALLVTQLVSHALNTVSGQKVAGKYRLALIFGLSIVTGVLGLVSQGVSLPAALLHSNTFAAYQVFAHQLYKQFFEKTS